MKDFIIIFLLLSLFLYPEINAQSCNGHPRILGSTSQYDAWRAKADSSPFKEMKAQGIIDAINNTGFFVFDSKRY